MDRRLAIKQIGIITGGIAILPSCLSTPENELSVSLNNISLTGDDEALISDLVQTIIPATDTPSAADLEVHKFVMKMVDDCYGSDKQKLFIDGLGQLQVMAKSQYGNDFSNCTTEEKASLLETIENDKESTLKDFYGILKRRTVQGYLKSEYIMKNVLVHNMIPGRFEGCIKIEETSKQKIAS